MADKGPGGGIIGDTLRAQSAIGITDAPTTEKVLEMLCPQIKQAKCTHQKDGRWDYWSADSGLCWCNQCGMCLNGRWEYAEGFFRYSSRMAY